MAITSQRIISDDQGSPLRRVVYGYTTQDGVEHVVGPLYLDAAIDPATDVAARAPQVWQGLVDQDVAEAIDIVRRFGLVAVQKAGGDPTQVTASYATAAEIYPALFDWWATAPTLEAAGLVPGIDGVTDAQLQALIPGITAADIAAIRARAATLRPISQALIADGGV